MGIAIAVILYNGYFTKLINTHGCILPITKNEGIAGARDIVGRANPRKATQTPRRAPRSRKTATGMRQDGTGEAKTDGQNQAAPAPTTLNAGGPGTTQ